MWMNAGGGGRGSLVLAGGELKFHANMQHSGSHYILPSPDGQTLFGHIHINARGFMCRTGVVYTNEFKLLSGGEEGGEGRFYLPAQQGPYYLHPGEGVLTFFVLGDSRPFATLGKVDFGAKDSGDASLPFDKRLWFLPEAKLIVTIPTGNDRLVLHRFDPDQALEKSDVNYFLVTSQAPATFPKGGTYRYQLVARAKKGPVKFKLESGPPGMKIGPNGQLTWDVPADFVEAQVDVIIAVSDATGQEIFHTFKIAPESKGEPGAAPGKGRG
jgi:hypothetical protein